MLGMIFGVAAVVSMLSIGAGARQKVMALIEQMGVHNLIVEAKETTEWQAHMKIRKVSPGLTLQDYRIIQDDVNDIASSTPRKRFTPSKTIPKAQQDSPTVYGVSSRYTDIMGLHLQQGRFFAHDEEDRASSVCVLGTGAKLNLFGANNAIGEWVKLNQQWFQVIGVASPLLSSQSEVSGVPAQDLNNLIYVPLKAAIFRLEDSYSETRDEIDGIYLHLRDSANVPQVAQVVRAWRGILIVAVGPTARMRPPCTRIAPFSIGGSVGEG
jgi:putative ABC transport system permease protein